MGQSWRESHELKQELFLQLSKVSMLSGFRDVYGYPAVQSLDFPGLSFDIWSEREEAGRVP